MSATTGTELAGVKSGTAFDSAWPLQASARKPVILHITADYPDANRKITTVAVKNFIDANSDAEHVVISLNRTAFPWRENVVAGDGEGDDGVISVRYWGLPLGVQLAAFMYRLAHRLHRIVEARGLHPRLIHAHKLTIEGLTGYWLSRRLGVPMVCSIRGEVEEKIFRFKPTYYPLYGRALHRCEHIYYVSAWFRTALERRYSVSQERQSLLPNFVRLDKIRPRRDFIPNTFASILHLDVYKKKGLDKLLPAFCDALGCIPDARLDLIGRGQPETLVRLERLIDRYRLSDRVRLLGPQNHVELLRRLPDYAAMVLPSRNETFGMAYIEALLSGVPVLYSKGTGIDGYLDDIEAAIGVEQRSVRAIRDGLILLSSHQHEFREWLLTNHGIIKDRFSAEVYIRQYNKTIAAMPGIRFK